MRRQLLKFLYKLIGYLESPVNARVVELVKWADDTLDVTGERKRNQVLSRLVAEFPNIPKRDHSYAIERVLQGL